METAVGVLPGVLVLAAVLAGCSAGEAGEAAPSPAEPSAQPSVEPAAEASPGPSVEPSAQPSDQPSGQQALVLDDLREMPPTGTDAYGTPVGIQSFGSPEATVAFGVVAAPEPTPDGAEEALTLEVTSSGYAGVLRVLGDGTGWEPVDASGTDGLRLSFLGEATGAVWFVDVLDNRSRGDVDDAGRWTAYFVDDTTGWRTLSWTWDELERKDVGNDAPDDGLTLEEVNGWAVGVLDTGPGGTTAFLADVALVSGPVEPVPAPDPAPAASPPSTVAPAQ